MLETPCHLPITYRNTIMASKDDITQEYLSECLDYDQETGDLVWKIRPLSHFHCVKNAENWNTEHALNIAGNVIKNVSNKSYLTINISSAQFLAHRLIFVIMSGSWPKLEVDHIDGNGLNNAWSNLREASKTENNRNARLRSDNPSGRLGLIKPKNRKKWMASIGVNGETIILGWYKSKQAAIIRRIAGELKYGYHPNHGTIRPL